MNEMINPLRAVVTEVGLSGLVGRDENEVSKVQTFYDGVRFKTTIYALVSYTRTLPHFSWYGPMLEGASTVSPRYGGCYERVRET